MYLDEIHAQFEHGDEEDENEENSFSKKRSLIMQHTVSCNVVRAFV